MVLPAGRSAAIGDVGSPVMCFGLLVPTEMKVAIDEETSKC